MKQQHDDLERLEAMDAALNTEPVLSEVDKILKKPSATFGLFSGRTGSSSGNGGVGAGVATARRASGVGAAAMDFASLNRDDLNLAAATDAQRENDDSFGAEPMATARSAKSAALRNASSFGRRGGGPPSPGGATPPASAPDAQARYAKAKVKQLEAALAESDQVRLKINEQLAETKRLLLAEREEGKKHKNRVKLLEIENRKGGGGAAGTGRRPGSGGGAGAAAAGGGGASEDAQVDSLKQEVEQLRKDLATAERLVKAAEASAKAKETQINRTTEIIARQKKQLADLGSHEAGSRETERARADAAEARCKVLEKQRADLVAGFKKQMKLIDNLKRQKVGWLASHLIDYYSPCGSPPHFPHPTPTTAAPRGRPCPRLYRGRVYEVVGLDCIAISIALLFPPLSSPPRRA